MVHWSHIKVHTVLIPTLTRERHEETSGSLPTSLDYLVLQIPVRDHVSKHKMDIS